MPGGGALRGLLARRHAVAWLLAVLVALLGVALVGVFRAYQATTWQLIHERDRQVAYLSAARLRDEVLRYAASLQAVARDPDLLSGSASARREVLATAAPSLAVFDAGVVLLDSTGTVRGALPTRPEILGADWSQRDYFRAQLVAPGAALSNIHEDASNGDPVVAVSVPLIDGEGDFGGVLAGLFRLGESSLSTLYASIVRLRLGQSGTTYVVDGQGRVIYDSSYGQVGLPIADRGLAVLPTPGTVDALRTRDREGHDVLVAQAPVPGTPWSLILEEDWATLDQASAQVRQALRALLGALVAVAVVGVLVLRARQGSDNGRLAWAVPGAGHVSDVVQAVLAPRHEALLSGWSLAGHLCPGQGGARDLHDHALLPDGRLLLLAAALPGEPALAARCMGTLRTAVRSAVWRGLAPAAALGEANRLLVAETGLAAPVGCFLGLVDPVTGDVAYANGGYPPPRHVTATDLVDLPAGEAALGVSLDGAWADRVLRLAPGECLVVHSIDPGLLGEPAGDPRALDGVCLAVHERTETADHRLEDLLAELREVKGHRRLEVRGYALLVLVRAGGVPDATVEA